MGKYLIWSNEHNGRWWGPGACGYETRVENAGRYSREQALDICSKAMPGTTQQLGMLPELPVLVEDVEFMLAIFRGLYPDYDPEPAK